MINTPWAIQPAKLIELQAIYGQHMQGKASARPMQPARTQNYVVHGDTAIIPLTGILGKTSDILMQLFGGTATRDVSYQFSAALRDTSVKQIMLYIDSPGGTVDGTQALANQIQTARGTKPVIAYSDGMMCSAAYWIGAAADRIYAGNETVQVGSIGVVAGHVDISGAEAAQGVKTTEITAGKFKRVASAYAPLSEDGRANIQETVDYLYSIFVADVAKARRVSENRVLASMADGRVFIGQQALDAGLIDGIQTLNQCLKGIAPMKTTQSASQEQTRQGIHEAAKAYQAKHHGIDYLAALRAVGNTDFVPAASDERGEMYAKAKTYQLAHPGTDLMTALRATQGA